MRWSPGTAGFLRVALLLVVICATSSLVGCAYFGTVRDSGGLSEDEARALSLRKQYMLAEDRWEQFNEEYAAVQREISSGEWRRNPDPFEASPGGGGSRANRLMGATRDNSYFFSSYRELVVDGDVDAMLRGILIRWSAVYPEVDTLDLETGHGRITAATEDGFWIELSPTVDGLGLDACSPVYWGDHHELLLAIGDRLETERLAGETWNTKVREDGTSFHLPGDYRPFPDWETEPTKSELGGD